MSDVKRHAVMAGSEVSEMVFASDYDKLVAENKALKEELAILRERLEIDPSHPYDGIDCRDKTIEGLQEQVDALRARVVVVPNRRPDDYPSPRTRDAWNDCLDETARLNGKTVSEGLLRRVVTPALTGSDAQDRIDALEELRALLQP
ncbi:hypothetical protein D3C78_1178650 [compost metagenome]